MSIHKTLLLYCLLIYLCPRGNAQDVPTTQLFLFDYVLDQDKKMSLTSPRWISSFNPKGYNNQPRYQDGWWYFSARMKDSTQNDIFAANPKSEMLRQVTQTKDSEYSPTPLNGNEFTTVRVEPDGSQRLWKYKMGAEPTREVLYPSIKTVGYHQWMNDGTAALFVVGDVGSLQIAKDANSLPRFITSRISRCFQKTSDGTLYFSQRASDLSPWQLKKWKTTDSRATPIWACPEGAEDFVILEDKYVLISAGQKLFILDLKEIDNGWTLAADLSAFGWKKITRLAANEKNELMIVVNYND